MTIDNSLVMQNIQNTKNINKDLNNLENIGDEKLREQTDNFEAMMLKQVLDISLKHENSLFPQEAGDKIYNSMYNDAMSKSLSGNMGYSELLFQYLKEGR